MKKDVTFWRSFWRSYLIESLSMLSGKHANYITNVLWCTSIFIIYKITVCAITPITPLAKCFLYIALSMMRLGSNSLWEARLFCTRWFDCASLRHWLALRASGHRKWRHEPEKENKATGIKSTSSLLHSPDDDYPAVSDNSVFTC